MKILLVTLDSKFIHSNIAVRYLKKYCKDDKSVNIEIKEFTINQQIEYILNEIYTSQADIVCFSCYIWNINYIKEIAYILKQADKNIKILFGGPEVSFDVINIMKQENYIDYIIFGEGEVTFKEFIQHYNLSKPEWSKINGLAYRENNSIKINEKRQLIDNLDLISYPYNEEDDFTDKIIYYESSRGCPFSCSFCMSSIDKKARNFSLDRVKTDLNNILNTNARQIKFVDRTFNTDYKRAIEIMEFIISNNKNKMAIHFEITADIINEAFLEFLDGVPTNMFQFEIGVQSLNSDTLIEINRHMNLNKLNYVVSRIASNNNIHIHLDLIAGLPYESYDIFKTSFDGIYKLNVEKIQLGFLKVLKGTQIHSQIKKHDIKYRRDAPYEVICTKHLSFKDILKLKKIEELIDKYYNEKHFEKSLNYIIEEYYNSRPFEFYEKMSFYWGNNDLYKVSHSRKKLYEILYKFIKSENKLTEEFINCLRYDFIFNNQHEELPFFLNPHSEEKYRLIKRSISNNEEFRNKYFSKIKKQVKIINLFRLIEINECKVIFIYEDKNNIFNRCRTYEINHLIEELENE